MTKRPGKNATKAQRVEYIIRLMESGVWRRGRTYKLLAKEWGLSRATLMADSAEASRAVKRNIMDPDSVAVDVGLALQEALEDALDDAKSARGTREGLKARDQVMTAAKIWSDISGATSPKRVELEHKEVKATPEEAARKMRELFGKVTPGSD